VEVLAYGTEGSYDSTRWNIIETKARAVDQFFSGNLNSSEMSDIGDDSDVDSYRMAKAITSGDPRVLEKAGLESEVETLERRYKGFVNEQARIRREISEKTNQNERWKERIAYFETKVKPKATDLRGDAFKITIDGKVYTDRTEAAEAVQKHADNSRHLYEDDHTIGEISGFELRFSIERDRFDATNKVFEVYVNEKYLEDYGYVFTKKEPASAIGFAAKITRPINDIDDLIKHAKESVQSNILSVENLKGQIVDKFKGEDELVTKKVRVAELTKELEAGAESAVDEIPEWKYTDEMPQASVSRGRGKDTDVASLKNAIADKLKQYGWPNIKVEITTADLAAKGFNKEIDGAYWNKTIYLAMSKSPLENLDHEMIHALRNVGAFTQGEWQLLEAKADEWIEKYSIESDYKDLPRANLKEEAIARAFADYNTQGSIRRIINRILRFLESIKDVLTTGEWDFARPEAVFDNINAGKLSEQERSQTPMSDDEIRFSLGISKGTKDEMLDDAMMEVEKRVKGFKTKKPADLGTLGWYLNHPRHIAANFPTFARVFHNAIEMQETRDTLIHSMHEKIIAYNNLNATQKKNVNAALELGRFEGKTFAPNAEGKIVEKNTRSENLLFSSKGDTIQLTEAETKAYLTTREVMDDLLNIKKLSVLMDTGFYEKGIKTSKELSSYALKLEEGSEKEYAITLAVKLKSIEDAARKGYVPFDRWGDVGVLVKQKVEGKPKEEWPVAWFQKVDTTAYIDMPANLKNKSNSIGEQPAVKRALEAANKLFPAEKYTIQTFPMAEFADVKGKLDLKDLDILASQSDLDSQKWEEARAALDLEIKKRGSGAHYLPSKNIPGYSSDFERAINSRILAEAGSYARSMYMPRIQKVITRMAENNIRPKLLEYTTAYVDYISDPKEEIAIFRQLGFVYGIVGRPMTALVNLSQTAITSWPILTSLFGKTNLATAYNEARKMFSVSNGLDIFDPNKASPNIRSAMLLAWEKGIFIPRDTFDIMGRASTETAGVRSMSKSYRDAVDVANIMFSGAERTNRVTAFIGAYLGAGEVKNVETAIRYLQKDGLGKEMVLKGEISLTNLPITNGVVDEAFRFDFANFIVVETQFISGKINRPVMFRGNYGVNFGQFKSFVIQIIELMYRQWSRHGATGKKALLAIAFSLFMFAGVEGIPFVKDLNRLAGKMYYIMTKVDVNPLVEARKFIANDLGLGATTASVILNGVIPNIINVDLSSRIGMGQIVPNGELLDFAGAGVGIVVRALENSFNDLSRGDYLLAFGDLLPKAVSDPITAIDMYMEGIKQRSGVGKTVISPDDLSGYDALIKAAGGTTLNVRNQREAIYAIGFEQRSVDKLRQSYYTSLAAEYARASRANEKGDVEAWKGHLEQIEQYQREIADYNQGKQPHEIIDIYSKRYRTNMIKKIKQELGGNAVQKTPAKMLDEAGQIKRAYGVEK
jgi:hypothetical protein